MKISIQKIYGNIGEEVCQRHLAAHMDSHVRADEFNFIGSSLLKPEIKPSFDISDIREVSEKCRNSGYCEFVGNERPCLKDDFFTPNFEAVSLLNFKDTGDEKYRWYCAIRNTKLEIDSYKEGKFSGKDQFIRDYLICHFFIQNYYYREAERRDYNGLNETEKKEFHKYWNGHPGRLDFFAHSGERFYCIDSKVNSSRLSLWQQVRLSWMQSCGHICQIYSVKFKCADKDKLTAIYCSEGVEAAIDHLNPQVHIIEYESSKYPEAERLVADREKLLKISREKYVWFS